MSGINRPIDPRGPLIDVTIGVSAPRKALLESLNLLVRAPVAGTFLIDSGAACTFVDEEWVVHALDLKPRGAVKVHTPTLDGQPIFMNSYDISLIVPGSPEAGYFEALQVGGCRLGIEGVDGLLGQDVLSKAVFIHDGPKKQFSLVF